MRMKQPGSTTPIPTVRSVRPDEWRGLTSMKPGVIVPVAYFPLLREDRIRGSLLVQVKSQETLHVVVNPVRVRVEAYLIPKTALERFAGSMEVLNRSYMDEPAPSGMGTTPKWFVQDMNPLTKDDTGYPLFDALGIHYKTGTSGMPSFNSDLCESYNMLVNWMRKQVSQDLPLLPLDNPGFAAAFWDNHRFDHIKPSFDAEQMEGSVPVGLDGTLPVWNILAMETDNVNTTNVIDRVGNSTPANVNHRHAIVDISKFGGAMQPQPNDSGPIIDFANTQAGVSSSATISLANIEAARKSQAFAAMRDRYKTVPEEYLVDLLMRGITIPESDLRQPFLLGMGEAVIGQTERFATDADNLDVSVSNGVAQIALRINTPPINSGGMVLVVASIVPEQLFERVKDHFLGYQWGQKDDVVTPDYMADYLDPQKVVVVTNGYADTFHSDPGGIFGYAPLNHQWRRSFARVGGRFKRPLPDAFKEDRQRIWAVEMTDPTLGADWYLCPQPFPQTVFADQTSDPYEVIVIGKTEIVGPTVFGGGFEEDRNSYEEVMSDVDTSRISGDPVIDAAVAAAQQQPVTEGEAQ